MVRNWIVGMEFSAPVDPVPYRPLGDIDQMTERFDHTSSGSFGASNSSPILDALERKYSFHYSLRHAEILREVPLLPGSHDRRGRRRALLDALGLSFQFLNAFGCQIELWPVLTRRS